jgi:NTP pyrophosphatase (non-canonical NTP hydrolase)
MGIRESDVTMDLNRIAHRQFDWVERMGWHNKTVLEALALIASEVGEAAEECFDGKPSDAFGEELADIILRTADLAVLEKIDLETVVTGASVEWRSKSLLEDFAELIVEISKWINTARGDVLGNEFAQAMGRFVLRVVEMAERYGVNLEQEVLRKMEINEQRGTRGRRI